MTLVIVPDEVADVINDAIDEFLEQHPEASPDLRDYMFRRMLDVFDRTGCIPTIVKREATP